MEKMIGKDYIFIDIPKTGTTAIVNRLLSSDETRGGAPIHSHIPLSSYIDILGIDRIKKTYVFTVVRNPYDRIVSIWKYYIKLRSRYHEIDPETPTTKDCPHRVSTLKYLEKTPNFDAFVDDILSYDPPPSFSNESLSYSHSFPFSDVFRRNQFTMLYPGFPHINKIIKFEQMDKGWREVCDDMEWDHKPLDKVNTSGGANWDSFFSEEQIVALKPLLKSDLQIWDNL